MAETTTLSDDSFEKEVLQEDKVALVEFWAPWCGPCKVLGPVIDEIALQRRNQIKVAKLDVDENPITTAKYSVLSIPTTIIFKQGEVKSTIIGSVTKEELESHIEKVLNG